MKKIISIVLSISILATMAIFSASAYDFDFIPPYGEDGYIQLNRGTKSTPYGTITGEVKYTFDSGHGYGAELYLWGTTSINSSLTMRKTSVSIDTVLTSTGEAIDHGAATQTNQNQNSASIVIDNPIGTGNRVTAYTAHQVIYTDAYVLYLVSITPEAPNGWVR